MSDFSYELPDDKEFFNAVMTVLKLDPKYKGYGYYSILCDGYCEIFASSTYSQKRWDAMYTTVNFYVSQDVFASHAPYLSEIKDTLLNVCQSVMPPNAGYDIMKINISPSLKIGHNDVLNEIIATANLSKLDILSDEIKQKGKEMSELYVTNILNTT